MEEDNVDAKNAENQKASNKIKNQLKKKLKKWAIKAAIIVLIFVFIVGAFMGVIMTLSNKLKELYATLTTFEDNILEFLGKDNWIDLDEKIERQVNGTIKKQTIVDHYIEELQSMGISLKDLRLLGEVDYSDPNVLEDEENKEMMQKYIKEFIRADIISRQIHRTNGDKNVQSYQHENLIDGGVYIYRTKDETTNTTVGKKEKTVYRMEYTEYEEFIELQETISDNMSDNKIKKLEEAFTLDPNTQELLFYKVDTEEYEKEEYKLGTTEKYKTATVNIERYDYQSTIAEYTLPYEFLINLCVITQNPEFVYHVAHLARETKINLLIQDNMTVTDTTEITSGTVKKHWEKYGIKPTDGSLGEKVGSGIDDLGYQSPLIKIHKINTVDVPYVKIMKVDAWSAALLNAYTNRIEKISTEQQNNIGNINLSYSDTSQEYSPETNTVISITYSNYSAENCTKTITETITRNIYEEMPVVDKVRKSKQFLGLLRNQTGECPYDCFEHKSYVQDCVKEATFLKEGINVEYKIPNQTRKECPLNKLISGEKLLYLSLDNTTTYNGQEDNSGYAERMQGLKEYVQYLLTYPPNEEIGEVLSDEEIGDILDIDDNNDDDTEYIPEYTWDGTTDELIEMLGQYAHEDMQESGILASVTVAQALLESGWGKSQLSATYNNYFGIKKGSNWNGPTVTMTTKEENRQGKLYKIKAEFRVYDSPYASIKDHSKILHASRYKGVVGEKNYRKAITIIKEGGYATDSGYVNKICKVIEKYGLTRFD